MRIGGQWVGLGKGDTSPEVQKIKAHMRLRFKSYAGELADTPLYDDQMVAAVTEMQRRYKAAGRIGEFTPGIINPETKYAMAYLPRPPAQDKRPVLFTVCGTGVPWWVGPDADTARAVEGQYRHQPIGYPAAPAPMGPSIAAGSGELVKQFNIHRAQVERHGCAMAGYSQGGIVVSEVFLQEIRPKAGRLNWALPHLRKVVTFGNPCRERGRVWPDPGGRPAPPGHGGVTPVLMDNTPEWWRDYAHAGDLYSDSPADESGENRTAIWKIVHNGDIARGPDSLVSQAVELTGATDASAVAEVVGMAKAAFDALFFFGSGTKQHINYDVRPAIDFLAGRA